MPVFRSILRLALVPITLLFAAPLAAETGWSKVVEDVPGRLVLELTPPPAESRGAEAGRPARITCPGCQAAQVFGSPELPFHRFEVLSGPGEIRVDVQVVETQVIPLPSGLASVPFFPTPRRSEERPNRALFRAAATLAPKVSGVRTFRGAPVRGVEIPLATWSESSREAAFARRLRVTLTFPGVRARPSPLKLPTTFRAMVRNPSGGSWLYESTRPRLRKRAAGAASAGNPGDRYIRIRLGDKTVSGLAEDQVYAVSFDALAKASADLRGIRVDSLRLYTGANDTLRRRMDSLPTDAVEMPGMLKEIPMEVVDGNGTFDTGDTLKFFGHGTSTWRRLPGDSGTVRYEFTVDPYSYENSYYIGFARQAASQAALRMQGDPDLAPTASAISSTPHYLRAEEDRETASCDPSSFKDEESGFAWFWHWKGRCDTYMDTTVTLGRAQLVTREMDSLPDLDQSAGDTLGLGFFVYESGREDNFKVHYAGRGPLSRDTVQGSRGAWYSFEGTWPQAPAFRLDSVVWNGSEKRFEGYSVRYRRAHVFRGQPLWIFPERSGTRQTYRVQGSLAGASVLRVVDGVARRKLVFDSQGRFTDSLPPDADARYLVYRDAAKLPDGSFTEEVLPAPALAIRNLLTGDGLNPEYLIVTGRDLAAQAAELRDYRQDSKRALPLKTAVVHVEDIYRQFGSGRLSPPAIRDFLRWATHRWDAGGPAASPLKYVVFFGDGHYDYRGIHSAGLDHIPPNVVPPYEYITPNRREQVATEDFYGGLDPGDNHLDSLLLDIAIGRVPVQTREQASGYLEKVKAYENPALSGVWRGRVILTSDDHLQRGAQNNLDPIGQGHTTDSEKLGKAMAVSEPALNLDRVNLLDYPINTSFRKPEAAQDLLTFINRGSLLVNYVGHGSSNQWADEVLLQTGDALSRMQNKGRTGLVNAFSCTVGRFESLESEGMSEQFVKVADAGAIGAISATRESFPNPNIALASAFYSRIFQVDSVSDRPPTVGQALMDAKNAMETSENLNDSKYALLGEPVILLRKPLLKVAINRAPDTLRALACDRLEGTVAGGSGKGMVNVRILAGSVLKEYELPPSMTNQFAEKRGAILFERTFPYQDGRFSTEYFLPRQISFGDTNARITAFAWDGTREMEGSSAILDLRIRGTASTCPADSNGKGPTIRITGCEKSETGEIDFPERIRLPLPYCLQINVEDSIGGVLSAEGPDEGTTVEVPGILDPFHPLPGIDDLYFKTYQMTLESRDFRPGNHLLKVSAKDGYGNVSLRTLRMDLTADTTIQTVTAYNVPNPVKRNGTSFRFSTILPQAEVELGGTAAASDRLSFEVRIHDQGGRVVKVLRNAKSGAFWNGKDEWGNLAANGVYFYTVKARWKQDPLSAAPSYRTLSSRRNTLVISR